MRGRLPAGGRIDRSKPLTFTFNGRRYEGFQGDTLASALLANGVRVVGRSIRYHRRRGIVGQGAEEPNAIVQIGEGALTLPNTRATQIDLVDGLVARSVNGWPGLRFDLFAVNDLLSGFLPPSVYYKTFMWPRSFWHWYERCIRQAGGLGVAPPQKDPDRYDKRNAHCDVLVIGGGPSGLSAALEAGRRGARVLLADDQAEFGGSLLGQREVINNQPAIDWVAEVVAELSALPNVQLLPRSTVFGYYDQNFLAALEQSVDRPLPETYSPRQRFWRVRARQVVLATGSFERPLVFHNNDRPGIMLASAVSSYINRYAAIPGSRAVIFTNNDSGYRTALDLLDAGGSVAAVIDIRAGLSGELPARVKAIGIPVFEEHIVLDVDGRKGVTGVRIAKLDSMRSSMGTSQSRIRCDLVAVSGGWNPAIEMHCQSGAKARYEESKGCFVPGPPVQAQCSAGACNGASTLRECLSEGIAAGATAAQLAGFGGYHPLVNPPVVSEIGQQELQPVWVVPSRYSLGRGPKQFVDFQRDTSAADIALALRENLQSIEHIKRYTLLGFGTDQGKLGNVNGIGIAAAAQETEIQAVGTTTFRPPYTPTTFGALAGRDVGSLFDPVRKTPFHEWHVEAGAVFEDVGQWRRARYYPRAGETMEDAVRRECLATRDSVGILDYSTLGKIEVLGPDTVRFLNLVYSNEKGKLAIGRCNYGLMLSEDGTLLDDGIAARLAENHYYLTTTTGGAARVMSWLERWLQTEWPEMRVFLTSVSDHWANIAINGPMSRALLAELCSDIDLSHQAFPFMSFREGNVASVPARVFRVSFSGELAYEVSVPANFGQTVWDAFMAAGEKYNITPYGTEAMHVLRADKGYLIVGQDADGSVTPVDAGMSWILSKGKDFLGKRSLSRPEMLRLDRKQLIGLLTEDPDEVLPEGGQVVGQGQMSIPMPMLGHVTSAYYSERVGRSIALALVRGGRDRMGETVFVAKHDGALVKATIASPVFYDAEGSRQNV